MHNYMKIGMIVVGINFGLASIAFGAGMPSFNLDLDDDVDESSDDELYEGQEFVNDVFDEEASKRSIDEIWTLLKSGKNVNVICAAGEATPLHIAAAAGDVELVRALLKAEARQVVVDSANNMPLHVAVLYRHIGVIRLLLQTASHVVLRFRNKRRYTPRDLARGSKRPDILALFPQ